MKFWITIVWLCCLTVYTVSHNDYIWGTLEQMAVQMVESHKTMVRKQP
jgi:hypothetical protein